MTILLVEGWREIQLREREGNRTEQKQSLDNNEQNKREKRRVVLVVDEKIIFKCSFTNYVIIYVRAHRKCDGPSSNLTYVRRTDTETGLVCARARAQDTNERAASMEEQRRGDSCIKLFISFSCLIILSPYVSYVRSSERE